MPGTIGRMLDNVPGLFVGRTPRDALVVIGRAHHRRVRIGLVPTFRSNEQAVRRHPVIAACLQGRDTLGEQERFAREIAWDIFDPLTMVIETNEVERTALEEVIVGRRFIASCRDGTCTVILPHNPCQVQGQQ